MKMSQSALGHVPGRAISVFCPNENMVCIDRKSDEMHREKIKKICTSLFSHTFFQSDHAQKCLFFPHVCEFRGWSQMSEWIVQRAFSYIFLLSSAQSQIDAYVLSYTARSANKFLHQFLCIDLSCPNQLKSVLFTLKVPVGTLDFNSHKQDMIMVSFS